MEPSLNTMNELARKLASSVPIDSDLLRSDLERNFLGLLRGTFERMDLVTREEFDVQRKVLERTREKLAALESEISALESRMEKSEESGSKES